MASTLVSVRSNRLAGGSDVGIPRAIGVPKPVNPIEYKIDLQAGPSGLPIPYIKSPPRTQPWDGPADIRIAAQGTVVFTLDAPGYECEFRYSEKDPPLDAITLGENNDYPHDPKKPRYRDLAHTVTGGKCKSFSFFAEKFAVKDVNRDPYNLYILVTYYDSAGKNPTVVKIRFDPDIKNPGDHGII